VVLIRDDLPRMNWSLGIVERLFEGRDGLVRAAVVKTSYGSKTRAVQKLHCLEISRSSDHEQPASEDEDGVVGRPVRQAALHAKFRDFVLK